MYTPKTFTIPELTGISNKTIESHLGLYEGYVKHVNLIHEKIAAFMSDPETNKYPIAEMQRRLGFEFGGMKNHEAYFAQFEDGAKACPDGAFATLVEKQFGSQEAFIETVKRIAKTRGVGWAMAYYDRAAEQIVCTWVDEQHFGQLADVEILLALDMWEHSYMLDHVPAEKGQYIDAFFANLNWEVVANRI